MNNECAICGKLLESTAMLVAPERRYCDQHEQPGNIKPCPMCGGPAHLGDLDEPQTSHVACAGRLCVQQIARYNPESAVAAWNSRQTPDTVRERALEEAAIADIAAERQRQISGERWTHDHDDDEHTAGEMAKAAACYAAPDNVHWVSQDEERNGVPATYMNFLSWPWSRKWWKPRDKRSNLVRAGALIIAEIERLDRANLRTKPQEEG